MPEMSLKFKPTAGQIRLAEAAFGAIALVQFVRPKVTAYQKEILQRNQWRASSEHAQEPQVVLDPEHAWTLNEADFAAYLSQCNQARQAAGLKVKCEGYCSLLEAKELERAAKRALIESFKPTLGIGWDDYLRNGMAALEKGVDLTLRLMAPYVDPHKRFNIPRVGATTPQ